MKRVYLIALTAAMGTLNVASAAWQKLPDTGEVPVNLASASIVGTKIISPTGGITNSQALSADDPTQLTKLSAGNSSVVIEASDQTMVEFASFINEGGRGKVSVSASTNNSDWVALSQLTFESEDRLVELTFAGIQAKYIKFSFDLFNSASISSVKLLGASKPSDYKAAVVKKEDKVSSNATAGASYSRRVYTFPTSTSYGKLENGQGSYEFPKTNEKYRTTIYDLGDIQTLKKFSAAYSKVPTRVEVFTFEQLPEKKDWRGKTTFDPSVLDSIKPVAIGEDASGIGRLNIDASQPVTAKYVVMRFEPNYSKRVAGLSAEWQSMACAALIPFSGMANQLGILDLSSIWHPVAAETPGGFVVFNVSMRPGGSSVKVHISKSAIAKVQQKMGLGTTETQAINAILKAAGLELVGGIQPGNGGGNGNDESLVSDPALSNALSGFGLSAYRNGGSGGIGGSGSSSGSSSTNSSGSSGSSSPIVIITNTVAPTTP